MGHFIPKTDTTTSRDTAKLCWAFLFKFYEVPIYPSRWFNWARIIYGKEQIIVSPSLKKKLGITGQANLIIKPHHVNDTPLHTPKTRWSIILALKSIGTMAFLRPFRQQGRLMAEGTLMEPFTEINSRPKVLCIAKHQADNWRTLSAFSPITKSGKVIKDPKDTETWNLMTFCQC